MDPSLHPTRGALGSSSEVGFLRAECGSSRCQRSAIPQQRYWSEAPTAGYSRPLRFRYAPMTPPRQPQLDLRISDRSPLVTIETARATLGIDEDSVLALIDCGKIRWAWDIAVLGGISRRLREVRIWAQCLVCHQSGLDQPGVDIATTVDSLLSGTASDWISAARVRALLCCSQQHIERLSRSQLLVGEVRGRARWILRSSLHRFLTTRVLA